MDPCKVASEKEKDSNLLKDLHLPRPETFQPPPPAIPDKNCLDSGALSASSTNPRTLQINITPYPFPQHQTLQLHQHKLLWKQPTRKTHPHRETQHLREESQEPPHQDLKHSAHLTSSDQHHVLSKPSNYYLRAPSSNH